MEPLNKGHLGTQAADPYSEVVPYWEVCIKNVLLQHHRLFWCIEIMSWCHEMKHYGVMNDPMRSVAETVTVAIVL